MHSGLTKSRTFFVLAGILLLCACTPEKKYRALSFFFDGVPNPSARGKLAENATEEEKAAATSDAGEAARKAQRARGEAEKEVYRSQHPPYVRRECESCHDRTSKNLLVTSKRKLCFNCHDENKFTGPYVHGPVAAGACLMCHQPHRSTQPALLLKSTPKLCLQCHDKKEVFANENHEGVTDCLECHQPHVAEDPMFMR